MINKEVSSYLLKNNNFTDLRNNSINHIPVAIGHVNSNPKHIVISLIKTQIHK